jgi:hypothetical protein
MNLNLYEVWHKAIDCYELNYYKRGWHRAAIVFGTGLVIYALVITVLYFENKKGGAK